MKTMKKGNDSERPGANPLVRLCLKDFFFNKGRFLTVAVVYFLWLLMIIATIKKFIFIMVIFPIFMVEELKRFEDRFKTESLFCSLPLKRSSIVYGKYFSSLFILIMAVIISFMPVLLLKILVPGFLPGPAEMISGERLIALLFAYVLFTAVSFLIYFRFGYLGYPGGIIVDFLTTVITATLIWGILYAIVSLNSGSWGLMQYSGEAGLINGFFIGVAGKTIAIMGKLFFFVFVILTMAVVMYTSINLSVKCYKKRDLK